MTRGFSRISKIGGGSSFDGSNFDGNNLDMDVLNRQEHLTETERQLFDEVIQDDELQELARIIESTNRIELIRC